MMRKLLALIAAGGSGTRESMAHTLGLRIAEIDDMLERLASLGFIDEIKTSCSSCSEGAGTCAACASCASCAERHFSAQARIWAVSAKGRNAMLNENESSMR